MRGGRRRLWQHGGVHLCLSVIKVLQRRHGFLKVLNSVVNTGHFALPFGHLVFKSTHIFVSLIEIVSPLEGLSGYLDLRIAGETILLFLFPYLLFELLVLKLEISNDFLLMLNG